MKQDEVKMIDDGIRCYLWRYPNLKKKWAYKHSTSNSKDATQHSR